jgi:hypothetical protein
MCNILTCVFVFVEEQYLRALKFNADDLKAEIEKGFQVELNRTRADFGEELEQLYETLSLQNKQMLKLKKQKEELNARVFSLSHQLEQ